MLFLNSCSIVVPASQYFSKGRLLWIHPITPIHLSLSLFLSYQTLSLFCSFSFSIWLRRWLVQVSKLHSTNFGTPARREHLFSQGVYIRLREGFWLVLFASLPHHPLDKACCRGRGPVVSSAWVMMPSLQQAAHWLTSSQTTWHEGRHFSKGGMLGRPKQQIHTARARFLGSSPLRHTIRTCRDVGRRTTDLSWGCGTQHIPSSNPDVGVNNCLWNLCGDWKGYVFGQNDRPIFL